MARRAKRRNGLGYVSSKHAVRARDEARNFRQHLRLAESATSSSCSLATLKLLEATYAAGALDAHLEAQFEENWTTSEVDRLWKQRDGIRRALQRVRNKIQKQCFSRR